MGIHGRIRRDGLADLSKSTYGRGEQASEFYLDYVRTPVGTSNLARRLTEWALYEKAQTPCRDASRLRRSWSV